jgi:hypothetical protein
MTDKAAVVPVHRTCDDDVRKEPAMAELDEVLFDYVAQGNPKSNEQVVEFFGTPARRLANDILGRQSPASSRSDQMPSPD